MKSWGPSWYLTGWWMWTTVGDWLRYHRRAADSEGDLPTSAVRVRLRDRQTSLEVRDTEESEPGECAVHLHRCRHPQPRLWRRLRLHCWRLQVMHNMRYPARVRKPRNRRQATLTVKCASILIPSNIYVHCTASYTRFYNLEVFPN